MQSQDPFVQAVEAFEIAADEYAAVALKAHRHNQRRWHSSCTFCFGEFQKWERSEARRTAAAFSEFIQSAVDQGWQGSEQTDGLLAYAFAQEPTVARAQAA